jgi:hypothetical protein
VPSNDNGFDTDRLRGPEWVIGAASVVLLVATFVLTWYGPRGQLQPVASALGAISFNGWQSNTIAGVLLLLSSLLGLGVFFSQASCRAPALPVTLTAMLNPLAGLTLLIVVIQMVFNRPGPSGFVSIRAGAVVGLVGCVVLVAAAYQSLRTDGIREIDGPQEIETFRQRTRPVNA